MAIATSFVWVTKREEGEEEEEEEEDLGRVGRVGLVEERPDFGLGLLPPGQAAVVVGLLEAELARQFLVGRLVRVQVQPVQHGQRLLRVSMLFTTVHNENEQQQQQQQQQNSESSSSVMTVLVIHQRIAAKTIRLVFLFLNKIFMEHGAETGPTGYPTVEKRLAANRNRFATG